MQVNFSQFGSQQVEEGQSIIAALKAIDRDLTKRACVARVNGKTVDLRTPLQDGDTVEILTFDDAEGRDAFRHSSSHIMAQAVQLGSEHPTHDTAPRLRKDSSFPNFHRVLSSKGQRSRSAPVSKADHSVQFHRKFQRCPPP